MAYLDEQLHGIIVPLVTTFMTDGRVDEKSLRNLANYVVDGGVNGIFVMGTTGEFQYLPFEALRSAIEIMVDEVGDRSLLLAGVPGSSVEETTRNVAVIGGLQAPPQALVVAPLCYHSNRNLHQHLERLSSLSELPILLYNNIGIVTRRWKRKVIIPDLVGKMASLSNVVGLKDSSGNLDYLTRTLSHQSSTFRVFQGEESLILPALKRGAAGAVPSLGNILPSLCADIYTAYLSGDMKSVEACERAINQIDALYPDNASIPPILKAYLARQGIIANPMSYIPFKGDAESFMVRLDSTIQAYK